MMQILFVHFLVQCTMMICSALALAHPLSYIAQQGSALTVWDEGNQQVTA